MATDHALPFARPERHDHARHDATIGLTVLALLLALTLGFSAADIQRERMLDAGHTGVLHEGQRPLDGRGKWAGYL